MKDLSYVLNSLLYAYIRAPEMAYEVFKRTAARVRTPTIAITPDGRIAVNAAAVRTLKAANVSSVLLLWDKDSCGLAIKAAPRGDRNAYALSVAPDSHSGGIRAKSFLAHIGWSAQSRVTLPATWNQGEKMLEALLPMTHLSTKKSADSKVRSKAGVASPDL